jgi:hypothetical protein
MTPQERTNHRRLKIGTAILRALSHDETQAVNMIVAELIGSAVEGEISGMKSRDLREFVGASAIEDMARELGMTYAEETERNKNAGCDPVRSEF